MSEKIVIGMIGFGTVGKKVYEILQELNETSKVLNETSFNVEVKHIAVKDLEKHRIVRPPEGVLVSDADSIVRDSDIQIIVEVMGGTTPTYEFARQALLHSKQFVTANKALIGSSALRLYRIAQLAPSKHKPGIFFEAAVGGGIPIIEILKRSLLGDTVREITGILNGTCNYILTKMEGSDSERPVSYEAALADAQAKGFAEADPTLDVNGDDTAAKLVIMAMLAFEKSYVAEDVQVTGITKVMLEDMVILRDLGRTVRFIAYARKDSTAESLIVEPVAVREHQLFGQTKNENNVIMVNTAYRGTQTYAGKGAGGMATASAVVSDIFQAIRVVRKLDHAPSIPLGMIYPPRALHGDSWGRNDANAYYIRVKCENPEHMDQYLKAIESEKPGKLTLIKQDPTFFAAITESNATRVVMCSITNRLAKLMLDLTPDKLHPYSFVALPIRDDL